MPYRVTLTLVGGERTKGLETYQGITPRPGETIRVNIGNGSTSAKVTGVRKHPSRSPGSVTEGVDDVEAQEF
jgi:hypothetical protein